MKEVDTIAAAQIVAEDENIETQKTFNDIKEDLSVNDKMILDTITNSKLADKFNSTKPSRKSKYF